MSDFQLNKTSKKFFLKEGVFWQTFLLSLIATVIWRIYYPGLMSNDSVDQYLQAAVGSFTDWHPPLMSVILSMFFKLGWGIGELMLFQCLFAIFGLRCVISLSILFFSNQSISKQTSRAAATIATIFFLIPFLSPFMFFSIIFWKDAWLAIMLLWIISYLLWIFLNFESLSKRNFVIHILLLSLSSATVILVRHNANLILPVFCVFFAAFGKIKLGNIGLLTPVFLIFFAAVLNPVINSAFNVKSTNTGNLVLANDFANMLRLYPELRAEYPLAERNRYLPVICHKHVPVYWGINVGKENQDLRNEYVKAITTDRSKLLYTRLYLFEQMFERNNWYQLKMFYGIEANPIGLKINDDFTEVRTALYKLSEDTGNQWYFIWISGLHIVWLILNTFCALYFSVKVIIKRDRKSLFLLLLYSIPLSYYSSYVIAAVSPDYRYMYPSTLIMQVLIVSLLLSRILKFFQKPKFTNHK